MYNKYYNYYDNGLPVLEIKQIKSLLTLNFCNGLQKSDQQNNSKSCYLEIPKLTKLILVLLLAQFSKRSVQQTPSRRATRFFKVSQLSLLLLINSVFDKKNLELIRDWFPQLKGLRFLARTNCIANREEYLCLLSTLMYVIGGYVEKDHCLVCSFMQKEAF